jgi:hypothetical protein
VNAVPDMPSGVVSAVCTATDVEVKSGGVGGANCLMGQALCRVSAARFAKTFDAGCSSSTHYNEIWCAKYPAGCFFLGSTAYYNQRQSGKAGSGSQSVCCPASMALPKHDVAAVFAARPTDGKSRVSLAKACPTGYPIYEAYWKGYWHGDVCRETDSTTSWTWKCPLHCDQVSSGGAPYCVLSQTTEPCRATLRSQVGSSMPMSMSITNTLKGFNVVNPTPDECITYGKGKGFTIMSGQIGSPVGTSWIDPGQPGCFKWQNNKIYYNKVQKNSLSHYGGSCENKPGKWKSEFGGCVHTDAVLTHWKVDDPAWTDRIYTLSELGHFTPQNFDYVIQYRVGSLFSRKEDSIIKLPFDGRVYVLSEKKLADVQGTDYQKNVNIAVACPESWRTVAQGSLKSSGVGGGFAQAKSSTWTQTMGFCYYLDVSAGKSVKIGSGVDSKKIIFVSRGKRFGKYYQRVLQNEHAIDLWTYEKISTKKSKPIASTTSSNMVRIPIGGKGHWSSCQPDGCIFDAQYCLSSPIAGQCNIHKEDVEEKCSKWDKCGGVICADDYGDFCLARKYLDRVSASKRVGIPATESNCLALAKFQHGEKVERWRTGLWKGSSSAVPSGCSVQAQGDWKAHFNRQAGVPFSECSPRRSISWQQCLPYSVVENTVASTWGWKKLSVPTPSYFFVHPPASVHPFTGGQLTMWTTVLDKYTSNPTNSYNLNVIMIFDSINQEWFQHKVGVPLLHFKPYDREGWKTTSANQIKITFDVEYTYEYYASLDVVRWGYTDPGTCSVETIACVLC